jgi:hypothetical protein
MDVFTQPIIGFGVEAGTLDGVAVCRMFNDAVSGQTTPSYISTDHDPLFRFHRWRANLRIREIDEVKSVPYLPTPHPFVERLIETVQRAHLCRVFFGNSVDLTDKFAALRDYDNAHRVHRSLGGISPGHRAGLSTRTPASLEHCTWRHHCGGLFHTPMAARLRIRDGHANNRIEASHRRTRVRERRMLGFRSVRSAQRFLSVLSVVSDLFNCARHHLTAHQYRFYRDRAFHSWALASHA